MGYYINPESMTKEEFLNQHGSIINPSDPFDFSGDKLPVCLVDNYVFTAAAICYDSREFDAFSKYPDDARPKKWYAAAKTLLKPYCSLI